MTPLPPSSPATSPKNREESPVVIEARELCKTYRIGENLIHALNRVSLKIHRGEYVSIIGSSGSGKSTLMQLLGCLDSPTSGFISLDGLDISKVSDDRLSIVRRDKIGFVFQSFNLLPKLNVLQNVELPLIYANVPRKQRRERALAAIEAVGLAERIKNRPMQLSGGQSQRVAIARALVNNPKIIFGDEPTGALDSRTGEQILELFRNLSRSGQTVVLVTHDPKIAAETPRRIELKDGVIINSTDQP